MTFLLCQEAGRSEGEGLSWMGAECPRETAMIFTQSTSKELCKREEEGH